MIQLRRQHILMRDIAVTLESEDAWVEEKLKAMAWGKKGLSSRVLARWRARERFFPSLGDQQEPRRVLKICVTSRDRRRPRTPTCEPVG